MVHAYSAQTHAGMTPWYSISIIICCFSASIVLPAGDDVEDTKLFEINEDYIPNHFNNQPLNGTYTFYGESYDKVFVSLSKIFFSH